MKKKTVKKTVDKKPLSKKKQIDVRKKIIVFSVIFLLAMTFLWVGYFSFKLTGQSIISVDTFVDESGVSGDITITLKKGELLPENSKVLIQNENNSFNLTLSDLINEDTYSGVYFIEGSDLTGEGGGYGEPGEKIINPLINFELALFVIDGNDTSEEAIEGEVSFDSSYEYDISGEVSAEIVVGSVESEEGVLDEGVLDIEISSDKIIVETDYALSENGFGEDYIGEDFIDLIISINDLGIELNEGTFQISVLYGDVEIISFSGKIESFEEPVLEEEEETDVPLDEETPIEGYSGLVKEDVQETLEVFDIVDEVLVLTESEKVILRENLGIIAIQTKVNIKGDRIVVDFNTNGYSMTRSYDILVNEELEILLERDSILWLRDLVNHFSFEAQKEEFIEGYSFSYSEI